MKRLANCVIAALLATSASTLSTHADAAESGVLTRAELSKASGAQIYEHVCQGCHMADGKGATGAGNYPALAGNPKLASAQYAAATVLHGRSAMPGFVLRPDLRGFDAWVYFGLEDVQIADVVNHIRSHFGNQYDDPISAEQVRALHPENKESP